MPSFPTASVLAPASVRALTRPPGAPPTTVWTRAPARAQRGAKLWRNQRQRRNQSPSRRPRLRARVQRSPTVTPRPAPPLVSSPPARPPRQTGQSQQAAVHLVFQRQPGPAGQKVKPQAKLTLILMRNLVPKLLPAVQSLRTDLPVPAAAATASPTRPASRRALPPTSATRAASPLATLTARRATGTRAMSVTRAPLLTNPSRSPGTPGRLVTPKLCPRPTSSSKSSRAPSATPRPAVSSTPPV